MLSNETPFSNFLRWNLRLFLAFPVLNICIWGYKFYMKYGFKMSYVVFSLSFNSSNLKNSIVISFCPFSYLETHIHYLVCATYI